MAPRKRQQPKKPNRTVFQLIGAQLALFRVAKGYTQAELAPLVIISESKLASIEQGRRPLTLTLAQELDRALETKGALEVAVNYTPDIDVYPTWAAEYMDHERDALAISSYENQVLPGLLQTREYAWAVFRSRVPILSEEEIEVQVSGRIERQAVLHRKEPVSVSFVISEAVLHDRLGGEQVYRDQLRHLRECSNLPGVTIQILPLAQQSHPALDGSFVLFETRQHEHLAYAETQRGSLVIYDPDEVSILAMRYAMLRTQALNPYDTQGLLDRLLGE
ncbi:helix-turn-helix domain-containing protein [Streptomyces sp. CBMA29]|uniref:helix-turn-helix domain-containing protein n=1 Tax=Streptomyces sp. CBMA29 TaxID=1896314 RepID=UPI001661A089|nr:helix-turn-helix transcriptional regulator [Streptomyces sp. CBMA29]MBD0736355.1 transcriptional regulator [Streptomyces sp. CBMA29]